jgi:predicted signal transduction protein with EAL and GGDEF domain
MPEHAVNPSARERRVALEKRRCVAEMSPEEMRRKLLTSEVTGLPNRRAFGEAGAALAVAMSDVDGLKALNKYGYEAGDAVLKGAILRERTILVERADGSTISVTGADFSYGVGKDIDEAESGLKSHKAEREARGEIARGELRGIIIKTETFPPGLSSLPRLPRQPVVSYPGKN